jgi:hypothetical protein
VKTRREFCKAVARAGVFGAAAAHAAEPVPPPDDGAADRCFWRGVVLQLATPVLGHLARRELKAVMPVETRGDVVDRRNSTHLEAFGRLLAGISPWLGARGFASAEADQQRRFLPLAQAGLDAATDPASPDFMNFHRGGQPLVDTAFLAQAILRAPDALWKPLDARVRRQLVAALKSSRVIRPPANNWVLFAATVEAALLTMGEATIAERLEGSLRQMLAWYQGDGAYGDGEFFHFDYYNSFVIHPMLVDVLATLRQRDAAFGPALEIVLRRARRFAEVQERLIAPDGTFPSLGRSTTYRFGAFQTLAQMALRHELPEHLPPAQVRCALTAVMRRMLAAPGTFDADGWLRLGFCGHQPTLGETYISTGSLYLCSVALLPLGLPPTDPFWTDPPAPWTSQRLWAGESLPADHALPDSPEPVHVPTLQREPARPSGQPAASQRP